VTAWQIRAVRAVLILYALGASLGLVGWVTGTVKRGQGIGVLISVFLAIFLFREYQKLKVRQFRGRTDEKR